MREPGDRRPLRVLLVAHGAPPDSVGGVEQHVAGLARALRAAGCDVHCYVRSDDGAPAGTLHPPQVGDDPPRTRVSYRFQDVADLAGIYRSPALDAAFRSFLDGAEAAGTGFDVAHVHHLSGVSTGVLDELARRRMPTALTLHDYWLLCPRGQMWHRRGELCAAVDVARCAECLAAPFGPLLGGDPAATVAALHRRAGELLALPRLLLAPSAAARAPFVAAGIPAERIRVVENAVEVEALAAVPPLAADRAGPLRVGYLGTLIPSKGLDVLVDAVQRLGPDVAALEVFGNAVPYHGDESFLTRTFARLRPGDRVRYHGPYRAERLPAILAGLDCVAVPAKWAETFGLTAREALAAGRPVVASRIGGLADCVRDGVDGIAVPPGDPGALATALAGLAASPSRLAAMGAAARGRARTFAAMAAELLGLYRDLAAAG